MATFTQAIRDLTREVEDLKANTSPWLLEISDFTVTILDKLATQTQEIAELRQMVATQTRKIAKLQQMQANLLPDTRVDQHMTADPQTLLGRHQEVKNTQKKARSGEYPLNSVSGKKTNFG